MDAPATLVWIAPEPPEPEQSRALASWSHVHGVRLSPPPRAVAPAWTVDGRIADGVETLLERARDAIAARDGDAADRALSSAESTLRAHPELPQAAWLMAEVQRGRAARLRRVPPSDPEAAELAWLRAEALDGGRVAGIGEQGSAKHPEPSTVAVELSADDVDLWLDGEPLRSHLRIETLAGLHALVAAWRGAPVWAEWIEVPPGSSSLQVSAAGAPSCSADDVANAHLAMNADSASPSPSSIDARRVRCHAWVAAVAGKRPGNVGVATCEADRCGPIFEWHAPAPWTWSPTVEQGHDRRWPAWATWSLVGVGVAVAAGVVIVAAGTLQPTPTETRFVNGGIKKQ
jgi:hypothetical protein